MATEMKGMESFFMHYAGFITDIGPFISNHDNLTDHMSVITDISSLPANERTCQMYIGRTIAELKVGMLIPIFEQHGHTWEQSQAQAFYQVTDIDTSGILLYMSWQSKAYAERSGHDDLPVNGNIKLELSSQAKFFVVSAKGWQILDATEQTKNFKEGLITLLKIPPTFPHLGESALAGGDFLSGGSGGALVVGSSASGATNVMQFRSGVESSSEKDAAKRLDELKILVRLKEGIMEDVRSVLDGNTKWEYDSAATLLTLRSRLSRDPRLHSIPVFRDTGVLKLLLKLRFQKEWPIPGGGKNQLALHLVHFQGVTVHETKPETYLQWPQGNSELVMALRNLKDAVSRATEAQTIEERIKGSSAGEHYRADDVQTRSTIFTRVCDLLIGFAENSSCSQGMNRETPSYLATFINTQYCAEVFEKVSIAMADSDLARKFKTTKDLYDFLHEGGRCLDPNVLTPAVYNEWFKQMVGRYTNVPDLNPEFTVARTKVGGGAPGGSYDGGRGDLGGRGGRGGRDTRGGGRGGARSSGRTTRDEWQQRQNQSLQDKQRNAVKRSGAAPGGEQEDYNDELGNTSQPKKKRSFPLPLVDENGKQNICYASIIHFFKAHGDGTEQPCGIGPDCTLVHLSDQRNPTKDECNRMPYILRKMKCSQKYKDIILQKAATMAAIL